MTAMQLKMKKADMYEMIASLNNETAINSIFAYIQRFITPDCPENTIQEPLFTEKEKEILQDFKGALKEAKKFNEGKGQMYSWEDVMHELSI